MKEIALALLDGYKVRWNRETVARDVVQNFFDATPDFDDVKIEIDDKKKLIEVSGPSSFELDYLRYLGASSKSDPSLRTVGGFGEGFKICALVLLRDYGTRVFAGSGTWEIRPFLRPMKLGNELCYEVREGSREGSFVRIEGADKRLRDAFRIAREFFRHPGNPRLANPIFQDEKTGVGVFVAAGDRGELFYRRAQRGVIRFKRGDALTFAHDGRLPELPIDSDRDRRDVNAAAPVIAEIAKHLPDDVLRDLVKRLRVYWSEGSRVLATILKEAARRELRIEFPPRWLARTRLDYKLAKIAEKRGFHMGVEALGSVGMRLVTDRFGGAEQPRLPSPLEAGRFLVARGLYQELAGSAPLYDRLLVRTIPDRYRRHSGSTCVVREGALAAPFEDGIAEVLGELATGSGRFSPNNADRITALIDGAVRRAGKLDAWAKRWEKPGRSDLPAPADEENELDALEALRSGLAAWLMCGVAAPPGFPPAEEAARRIQRAGLSLGVRASAMRYQVCGPVDAQKKDVRGVLSVWIGGIDLGATSRKAGAYLRTFDGALVPSEDAIRDAIRDQIELTGRGRQPLFKLLGRMRRADRRWLERNDPPGWERLLVREAVEFVQIDRADVPWELVGAARKDAVEKLLADERERDASRIAAAVAESWGRVLRALARAEEAAPGVSAEARDELANLLQKEDFARLEERAVALAPGVRDLARAMSTHVALDEGCARSCRQRAWRTFGERRGETDAVARAIDRFRECVQLGVAFHARRDERGAPPDCSDFGKELDARFEKEPLSDQQQRDADCKAAVQRAWDEALAEGATEIEAARRALEAALPYDFALEPT